jgi:hypothetical protein
MRRAAGRSIAAVALLVGVACGASVFQRGEGLDPAAVPPEQQADYAVFAQRCSKCHSLARPLESGITEDSFWRTYVEKMRRQPGSGISEEDTVPILRFLHWFSATQQPDAQPPNVQPESAAP